MAGACASISPPRSQSATAPRARTGSTARPSTSAASGAASAAHSSVVAPARHSDSASDSVPRTARSEPSSATSPIAATPSRRAAGACEVAIRIPSATARSAEAPSFRRSAGARFTVTRRSGRWKPAFRSAGQMRSRASRTEGSGSPTRMKPGRPGPTSTSHSTGKASSPHSAAVRTRLNIADAPRGRDRGGVRATEARPGAAPRSSAGAAWAPTARNNRQTFLT